MNFNAWIRQLHRWLSIIFVTPVAGIFLTLALGVEPAQWVYYLPLPPLFLLMFSGLYMFALPYVRRARPAGQS